MRIHELSKQINVSSKEIIAKLAGLGIAVKSHMSNIDEETVKKLSAIYPAIKASAVKKKAPKPAAAKKKAVKKAAGPKAKTEKKAEPDTKKKELKKPAPRKTEEVTQKEEPAIEEDEIIIKRNIKPHIF